MVIFIMIWFFSGSIAGWWGLRDTNIENYGDLLNYILYLISYALLGGFAVMLVLAESDKFNNWKRKTVFWRKPNE